jgi:hypothetical protein
MNAPPRIDINAHFKNPWAHHRHQIATGRVFVNNVSNSNWSDSYRVAIDVDFTVISGSSVPYCVDEDGPYGGNCSDVDCRIQTELDGSVTPLEGTTKGCYIQYVAREAPEFGDDYFLAIFYILFGTGFANEITGEPPF